MLRLLRKYAPKQNRICLSLYPVHKKKFTVNNNEEFVEKVKLSNFNIPCFLVLQEVNKILF